MMKSKVFQIIIRFPWNYAQFSSFNSQISALYRLFTNSEARASRDISISRDRADRELKEKKIKKFMQKSIMKVKK